MTGKSVVTFKRLKPEFGIGWSRTHLDRLEDARKFPLSFKLEDHRNSPRVWWSHELIEYLESRARTRSDAPK
jgi:hypothetical protein